MSIKSLAFSTCQFGPNPFGYCVKTFHTVKQWMKNVDMANCQIEILFLHHIGFHISCHLVLIKVSLISLSAQPSWPKLSKLLQQSLPPPPVVVVFEPKSLISLSLSQFGSNCHGWTSMFCDSHCNYLCSPPPSRRWFPNPNPNLLSQLPALSL